MALGFSTGLANAFLDAMGNGGTTQAFWDSAILEIRSGTRAATADAAPTGTLLASMTLPADAMAAASALTLAKSGTWSDTSADAGAPTTATWFRIKRSGDLGTLNTTDKRIDGDISTVAAGTGDMQLVTTSITATQPVEVTTYQHSLPA
jgi:hypothetical protein